TGDVLRPLFIYISVIDLIFVSFLVVVISMWMLKKTSGPLYRMSQDIVKISQGDLTLNINLREKDEFKEVAQELNSALKNIKKLFRALNEKYSRVSASIIEVQKESAGSGAIRSDFSTVLARIEELEAEFRPLKFGKKQ
ncbi:MAG: methyl-accepting chemotaxis protein, partial [Nitrospirae bacterium]|nr:methyl-accepting chemotaxis protein [Nitrospirota bacterium]